MSVFSEENIQKIEVELNLIGPRHAELFEKIDRLSAVLKKDKSREYLFHGVGRRLSILKRCIENIFLIFPPKREDLLKVDELRDVDINLHAFFVNIFGLFDNLAWIKIFEEKLESKISKGNVGLFHPKIRKYFSKEFQEYLGSEQITKWYEGYFRNYRHALSHRIPLYVPPKSLSKEQKKQEDLLEVKISDAYKIRNFNIVPALREEQDAIGQVAPYFIHSLFEEERHVVLHAQMIADFKTVEEVVEKYCEMMGQSKMSITTNEEILRLQNLSKEHLYYEIWMLYEVTFRLASGVSDVVVRNAMIESFGIHSAIILDFLFNKIIKPDDVVADDYVKDVEAWKIIYSACVEKLSFVTQRRNKELAHLSYERLKVSPQEKLWSFIAITREIADLVDLFIDSANKELLHDNVVKLKYAYVNNPMWQHVPNFRSLSMREK